MNRLLALLALLPLILSSCGGGGNDGFYVSCTAGGESIEINDPNVGYLADGVKGTVTNNWGLRGDQKGFFTILDLDKPIEEAANIEDLKGKSYSCEIRLKKEDEPIKATCTLESFTEGEANKFLGMEYRITGKISGGAEGDFAIKVYKE